MYIIKFQGGLGNQMFQFALYYKLRQLGYKTKVDLSAYHSKNSEKRSFELYAAYDISLEEATDDEIHALYGLPDEPFRRAIKKRFEKRSFFREPRNSFRFCQEVFEREQGYLDGYWQSEKYFVDIKEQIAELFTPKQDIDFIPDENSAAIHVRMGDYLEQEYADLYGDICTKDYYFNAMELLTSKDNISKFYVFSDEIDKAKEMFGKDQRIEYVKGSETAPAYFDMFRISKCKHQIIANSSYSWWAAWLNKNTDKIVVAPRVWTRYESGQDVIPRDWTRL